ncbi:unnamed protein product [Closterium sp. NIES-54]
MAPCRARLPRGNMRWRIFQLKMPQSLPLPRLTFRSLMGLVLLQSLSRCCSHLLQREDGLSPAEKATTVHQLSYDDFLEDDLDEELDIDIQQEAAARLRYTAILLIPFMMKQELGSIINTVWVFLRKVWALSLTAGAVDTASVQSLPAMYIAKQHFCRLQVLFLKEEDAVAVRLKVVEYQRLKGKVNLFW